MNDTMMQDGVNSQTNNRLKKFILKNRRVGYFQVLYTPRRISSYMFIMGILFALIGIVMKYEYSKVVPVSKCIPTIVKAGDKASGVLSKPKNPPSRSVVSWSWDGTVCKIWFKVPKKMKPPVFIYYGLTGFYQNHRRYLASYDSSQLRGEYVRNPHKLDKNCEPLILASGQEGEEKLNEVRLDNSVYQVNEDAQIYPCGLKANSMFSDDISDDLVCIDADPDSEGNKLCSRSDSEEKYVYKFSEKGTAPYNHGELYGNINWRNYFESEVDFVRSIVPPPLWRTSWKKWKNGYTFDNYPKLKDWERFQSWMDSAGLPNFWKLWGVNHSEPLMPGIWELKIEDNFSASSFRGSKSIIISTTTALGAKNNFLVTAYFTCSVLFVLTGVFIAFKSLVKPRKYSEMNLIEEAPSSK